MKEKVLSVGWDRWLEWDVILSGGVYYLYLFIMTIYLRLPRSNEVCVNTVDFASHPNS